MFFYFLKLSSSDDVNARWQRRVLHSNIFSALILSLFSSKKEIESESWDVFLTIEVLVFSQRISSDCSLLIIMNSRRKCSSALVVFLESFWLSINVLLSWREVFCWSSVQVIFCVWRQWRHWNPIEYELTGRLFAKKPIKI